MFSWVLIESFNYAGEFDLDLALKKKRLSNLVGNNSTLIHDDLDSMNWSNVFRVYLLVS
jgi:hypothetical protein